LAFPAKTLFPVFFLYESVTFHFLPKIKDKTKRPIFRSNPPLVVGIPVFLAIFCLIADTPKARLRENDMPNFLPIISD